MRRYEHLYLLLILFMLSISPVVFAAETTEDFEGSSISNGGCVDEGEAIGSLEFTSPQNVGACLTVFGGSGGSKGIYVDYNRGISSYFTMSLATGGAFKFVSAYMDDAAGFGSSSYQVVGYSGGSPIEGPDTVTVSSAGTHTFNWNNVDSVRFIAIGSPNDVAAIFDDFVYDDPVPSNTAPTISINNTLELNEGATATIPDDFLSATDAEQDDADLTYTITDPADYGTIKNNGSDMGVNGTFTQANLTSDLITYVHGDGNNTSDSFTFKVADGVPNELTGQTYNITVKPVDDDTPTISTNNALDLNEGATAAIPLDSLEADDTDTDNSTLTFTVTSGPVNGQVENTDSSGDAITSFTQQNLMDGKIQYVHNGTNTKSDSFTFKVADGVPNEITDQDFTITVIPVDDPNIWTGAANNNWNTETNWSEGVVPDGTLDVDIPAVLNQPSVDTGSAECRKLNIRDGATLTIGENGALTVNDTYTKNGNGAIAASGGGFAIIKGDVYKGSVKRLEVDSTSGIKISSSLD